MNEAPLILVVDDSSVVLAAVETELHRAGFDVVTRETSLGTGATILRLKPAVVVLDVSMPRLDGPELVQLLRRNRNLAKLAVILWSDRSEGELAALMHQCGANGYAKKGSSFAPLINAIKRNLPKKNPFSAASAQVAPSEPYVLVVEPDPQQLDLLRGALGCLVRACYVTSPAHALALIRSNRPPDVVISEISLGTMNGLELLEGTKTSKDNWVERFMFTTGAIRDANVRDLLRTVRCPVLFKPLDAQQMLRTIKTVGGAACVRETELV